MVSLINEAFLSGSRIEKACNEAQISLRTYRRWYQGGEVHEDGRPTAKRSAPMNALSDDERKAIIDICNCPEYASLPPTQIVPRLLDKGKYIASESSFYRVLKSKGQLSHRGRQRSRQKVAKPTSYTATAPQEVFSWDITYLPSTVRRQYYYLYLIEDVYSRKIVGYEVHDRECGELAAQLLQRTVMREQCFNQPLVLHSDNGAPMKSSTLKAKMEELGITPSYSRPRVSDDNPYVESLFRTLKYVPSWPSNGFDDLAASRAWLGEFVHWYNTEHKHSRLNYITPSERHKGQDEAILRNREKVLQEQRKKRPDRWSGKVRNCQPIGSVHLNPEKQAA